MFSTHLVWQIGARPHLDTLMTCRDSSAVDRFIQVRHLDELVFYVGGALNAVVVGDRRGRADQGVADSGFADIAAAVITGESFNQ